MFYLGLENQIHLFIIIVFSSYIYLSSFSIRQPSAFIKHFGTAFFIPLVLCLMSFLSLNREHASSYLFFAEFILISALLLILLVQKNGDFTYVIFFLLYALPVCIGILNLNFDSIGRSAVFTRDWCLCRNFCHSSRFLHDFKRRNTCQCTASFQYVLRTAHTPKP